MIFFFLNLLILLRKHKINIIYKKHYYCEHTHTHTRTQMSEYTKPTDDLLFIEKGKKILTH